MLGSVLIVDDHLGFRVWARHFLETTGYRVSGEAGSGEEAIGAARRLRPDLILLDVHLPDIDGFEVARRLLDSDGHRPGIVLTSSRDRVEFGGRIAESGVLGFIAKDGLSAATLSAILAGSP